MARYVEKFAAGQEITANRLNRIGEAVNEANQAFFGSRGTSRYSAQATIALEIKTLNFPAQDLTCVLPGQGANGSAREWSVNLPNIFTEASRPPVSYVYTDINTRTASAAGETDETQFLTPPLTVGEVIQAYDLNGLWVMAGDGRMWAVDPPP